MVAESLNQKKSSSEIIIPQLRKDLKIIEDAVSTDRETSWIIYDPVNGKYFRIHRNEYNIISHLSKEFKLREFYELLTSSGTTVSEKDILSVVDFLSQNSLIVGRYFVTESLLERKIKAQKSAAVQKYLSSLLFLRIPIWNPDKFLNSTYDKVKSFFNKWTLYFLAALSIIGYICVIPQWSRLSSQFYSSLSYKGMIEYGITIIILKILHEFAHAYTAKMLNIPVRKMGLFFIIFFPRLYTDITDSWQVLERKKRMLIDGAGIIFEIAVGGLAALFWLNTGAGVVNSISYYVFAISALSAILVNGNPFIKYDGYFLLMDFLNIDNLQKQATTVLRQNIYAPILGIKMQNQPPSSYPIWKNNLLIVFSIVSFIYRFFLYTGIILIVYFMFTKTLALLLVAIEIYTLFYLPLKSEVKALSRYQTTMDHKKKMLAVSGIVLLLIIIFIPIPWNIEAPGEVSSLETVSIFVQNEGFLKKITAADAQVVNKEDELALLEDPFLKMDIKENNLELEILKTERNTASTKYNDLGIVKVKKEQIISVEKKIAEEERKQALLTITAPIAGTFALFDKHLKPGKWLKKGELIGEVVDRDKTVVFAYVKEKDISEVQVGDKAIFTLSDEIDGYYGKVISVSLVPFEKWRNSPLLNTSGGSIEVLEPKSDGTLNLLHNYYRIVIEPKNKFSIPEGRTGIVKLRKYSSIAGNLFRFALSLFQREFSF